MGRRCIILNRNIYNLINLFSIQTQMKKLFILSMILLSLTLVWFSQNNELSQSELFKKKQECINYKLTILEEIKNKWFNENDLQEIANTLTKAIANKNLICFIFDWFLF